MRNGKIYKLIICMFILVFTLTSCATFDNFKHTFIDNKKENKIYIGVLEPETGKYSESGLSEIKGIELANNIYNSVDGYTVELIKSDTQSSTLTAEAGIQSLIKMGVSAVIGSAGEATSLVASKYLDENRIPAITPSSINPLITQNSRYYFRASLTNAQMGAGAADYAYNYLSKGKLGVFVPLNDTTAIALRDGFSDRIKKNKGDDDSPILINKEIDVVDEEKAVDAIMQDTRKKDLDGVYMPFGLEFMDKFFTEAEKRNLTEVTYIGTKDWGNPKFVEMMKNHPKITIRFPYLSVMDSVYSSEKLTEEAEKFQLEYARQYGADDLPTDSAALGYDSYLLLINAIHNAKSLNGSDIRDAILSLKDVRCATGVFNFDENGNTVREVNISTIRGGKVISLHLIDEKHKAEEIEELKNQVETKETEKESKKETKKEAEDK